MRGPWSFELTCLYRVLILMFRRPRPGFLSRIPSFPRLGSIWALMQQQAVVILPVEDD